MLPVWDWGEVGSVKNHHSICLDLVYSIFIQRIRISTYHLSRVTLPSSQLCVTPKFVPSASIL